MRLSITREASGYIVAFVVVVIPLDCGYFVERVIQALLTTQAVSVRPGKAVGVVFFMLEVNSNSFVMKESLAVIPLVNSENPVVSGDHEVDQGCDWSPRCPPSGVAPLEAHLKAQVSTLPLTMASLGTFLVQCSLRRSSDIVLASSAMDKMTDRFLTPGGSAH